MTVCIVPFSVTLKCHVFFMCLLHYNYTAADETSLLICSPPNSLAMQCKSNRFPCHRKSLGPTQTYKGMAIDKRGPSNEYLVVDNARYIALELSSSAFVTVQPPQWLLSGGITRYSEGYPGF